MNVKDQGESSSPTPRQPEVTSATVSQPKKRTQALSSVSRKFRRRKVKPAGNRDNDAQRADSPAPVSKSEVLMNGDHSGTITTDSSLTPEDG